MADQTLFDAQEVWKDVPGYEGMYKVSNMGRLQSSQWGYWRICKGTTPKACAKTCPYIVFTLRKPGLKKNEQPAHVFILETFIGVAPHGMVCRHLNGNHKDNRLENLTWGTQKQNVADAVRHGTFRPPPLMLGESHPNSKATKEMVRAIRTNHANGKTVKSLAEELGLSKGNIYQILSRTTWKHVA